MGRRGGGHAVWWEIPALITRNYNYLHRFKLTGRCLFLVPVVLRIPAHTSLHRPILQPIPCGYPTRLCACAFLHTLLSIPGSLPVSVFVLCIPTHFSPSPSSNPSHEGSLPSLHPSLCLYCAFLPTSLPPWLPIHPKSVPCLLYTRLCACTCLLYTSPSPRDECTSRMPSSA